MARLSCSMNFDQIPLTIYASTYPNRSFADSMIPARATVPEDYHGPENPSNMTDGSQLIRRATDLAKALTNDGTLQGE